MCGRARCSLSREAVTAAAGLPRNVPLERWQGQERYRPSFNVSPGAWLPVLVLGAGGRRELRCMKCVARGPWGPGVQGIRRRWGACMGLAHCYAMLLLLRRLICECADMLPYSQGFSKWQGA